MHVHDPTLDLLFFSYMFHIEVQKKSGKKVYEKFCMWGKLFLHSVISGKCSKSCGMGENFSISYSGCVCEWCWKICGKSFTSFSIDIIFEMINLRINFVSSIVHMKIAKGFP